ncbi:hypothetical protein [Kaistia terrae]|uniref:Uncharacterized protein n=1 Tax=Kaistia terrae TaxID=537017 RepID=A0ABW0PWJ9_9HYPH|nr:hypothetical protein [Kaistia terrae]MCX5579466.1 hypothetical protein [Kaistia terrae]
MQVLMLILAVVPLVVGGGAILYPVSTMLICGVLAVYAGGALFLPSSGLAAIPAASILIVGGIGLCGLAGAIHAVRQMDPRPKPPKKNPYD